MQHINLKTTLTKIAASSLLTLFILGSAEVPAFADSNEKVIVPVAGKELDASTINHKTLDLREPGKEKIRDIEPEYDHRTFEISVPAGQEVHFAFDPIVNGSSFKVTVFNPSLVDYKEASSNTYTTPQYNYMETGYTIYRECNLFDFKNNTAEDATVTIDTWRDMKIENVDKGLIRMNVQRNSELAFYIDNAKAGDYILRYDYYSDDAYSVRDDNYSKSSGTNRWTTIFDHGDGWDSMKTTLVEHDNWWSTIEPQKDGFLTVSLIECTDISEYNIVLNDNLFEYSYTIPEDGLYVLNHKDSKNTVYGLSNKQKGDIVKYDSRGIIDDTVYEVAPLIDISECSKVSDYFDYFERRSYLFIPNETKDYYFDCESVDILVTDYRTYANTKVSDLSPVHLQAGQKYIISALKKGDASDFSFIIGDAIKDKPVEPDPITTDPSNNTDNPTPTELSFDDFVERLYVVALNRQSEKEGKDYWCELVGNGTLTGADCARFFLTSPEFKGRGLSDEDFLKVLYKTFFDRDAADDQDGFNFWMNSLKSVGKDTVVEGFINSPEWCNICADYGVKSGAPTVKATKASKNATAFATRLYTECLGREPEEGGLKYWSLGLTNCELSGSQAAHELFYCQEFNDHNFDNKELITRMYKTFMGRNPDDEGLNYWLTNMNNGMTKDQVFNSFVQSQEFTDICASYAITR